MKTKLLSLIDREVDNLLKTNSYISELCSWRDKNGSSSSNETRNRVSEAIISTLSDPFSEEFIEQSVETLASEGWTPEFECRVYESLQESCASGVIIDVFFYFLICRFLVETLALTFNTQMRSNSLQDGERVVFNH